MYICLRVQYLLFLSGFYEYSIFSKDFLNMLKNFYSINFAPFYPFYMQTEEKADIKCEKHYSCARQFSNAHNTNRKSNI